MSKNLFRYIWQHSKRDQLAIFAVVLLSLPLYYVSLDLPRRIVNEAIQGRAFEDGKTTATFLDVTLAFPSWLGGSSVQLWPGFEVGRLELLFGLSFLFLFFVLVNGFIKYWINVAKGALGERMMRRLRFELFESSLRFKPEALKNVRSAEVATIIKDEVEPIGGFIGDAFIQPLLLGTQAATALTFILIQNVWLGLLAGAVVGVQFLVIPRMRRELLRLGRMRQIASRRFAGRVSEVVDGIEAVQVHNTAGWERAEIGGRLHELFDIRFRIYKRKFIVKFLNNLLAQMTPFFFYAVGGYFALTGRLDIGQLVAVIAAYRELPPPLKELIDWDQQRLDVQVKYDQVVSYFSPDKLSPVEQEFDHTDAPLTGPLVISDLEVVDHHGLPTITGGRLRVDLPTSLAVVSDGTAAASALARILARRPEPYAGEIKIGERDICRLASEIVGQRMAYAGPDPVLFPGTIRDNLLYGLRQRQVEPPDQDPAELLRITEARRTGNPVDTIAASWVDHQQLGYSDLSELDGALLELLRGLGLEQDLYRFGIEGLIDPERQPKLAGRIVEARHRLHAKLEQEGMAELVERFDLDRYNRQATVVENLLFGVPVSKELIGRAILDHPGFRSVLDRSELDDALVEMGARIAETMTDIFRGLPPGHPLFDQFSFLHADELGEYEEILKRSRGRGRAGLTRDDRVRLMELPLGYIEPRHRLGLLDDALQARLLEARALLRAALESASEPQVEFYDPERVNTAAPLRDNLLFGRINETIADARERIRLAAAQIIDEMDLSSEIERVGLDHQVGPAGRLLTAIQRTSVNLIRCLVKHPDILVVDGALAPFGERRFQDVLDYLLRATEGRTLVVVLPNDRHAASFAAVIRFESGRLTLTQGPQPDRASEPLNSDTGRLVPQAAAE